MNDVSWSSGNRQQQCNDQCVPVVTGKTKINVRLYKYGRYQVTIMMKTCKQVLIYVSGLACSHTVL